MICDKYVTYHIWGRIKIIIRFKAKFLFEGPERRQNLSDYFYGNTNKMHQCIKFYFVLELHSTCFGRSFRPSPGVQDCTYSNRHLSNKYCCLLARRQTAVFVAVCTILNSWWWTERPSETCRVSFQNKIKFYTVVYLIDFTIERILRCSALWTPNQNLSDIGIGGV